MGDDKVAGAGPCRGRRLGALPPDPRGILTTMKGFGSRLRPAVQAEAPMTAHGESAPSPRTCPPEAGRGPALVQRIFIVAPNTSAGGFRRFGLAGRVRLT